MQSSKVIITAGVLLLTTLTAGLAWAQSHILLKSVAEVEREEVNPEGKKIIRRIPAVKVLPGQEVIFTTTYQNTGDKAAENAVITNPIPEHMIYRAGSASGAGTLITFSVDGGKTYDTPAQLFIRDPAGRKFPARLQDYTNIRWTFDKPLPPGAEGQVSFRAILQKF